MVVLFEGKNIWWPMELISVLAHLAKRNREASANEVMINPILMQYAC